MLGSAPAIEDLYLPIAALAVLVFPRRPAGLAEPAFGALLPAARQEGDDGLPEEQIAFAVLEKGPRLLQRELPEDHVAASDVSSGKDGDEFVDPVAAPPAVRCRSRSSMAFAVSLNRIKNE